MMITGHGGGTEELRTGWIVNKYLRYTVGIADALEESAREGVE